MLYRKYRPQKFSEIVGQEHVVKTLQGALESGRVGHAYLFTGSRGTGKTSLARIFAKALNCDYRRNQQPVIGNQLKADSRRPEAVLTEPCDNCHFCLAASQGNSLDLIEIDAASRTGVDDIRELNDSAMVAAPGGGYKIFLIDEVHMLSKSAFNALLKTLEEPPAHVIFILATTEPHKILPTVLSRVQRFDFKRLNHGQISEKLKMMAGKEGIKINDEAIKTIAMSADGALRDAEVALTKIHASVDPNKEVSAEDVNEILSLVSYKYYPEFLGRLLNNDRVGSMEVIQKIHMSGADMENFTGNLVEYLRNVLMAKINPAVLASVSGMNDEETKNISTLGQSVDSQRLIKMIVSFSNARNEIKHSPVPQLPLELAVIELTS
ncbi:MAG: DNA polymerase III subunit gamma/tau [Candidatus Yanofskybacteria bacterium]|nr:DNA polymerase III subunit gamma/tau [Candidatus Yanofskybacteria bacterium]